MQKKAEATGGFVRKKLMILREKKYISPVLRQKITGDLRLKEQNF